MDENPSVVNTESTNPTTVEVKAPEEANTTTPHQPGDKTDPNLLLKSLQEERAKAKQLEEEIELLKSSTPIDNEIVSDEGKILSAEIARLRSDMAVVKQESSKKDVLISNPILKDKWEEFEEFRADPENKGMNMKTAAKAYLVENGLLEPVRKGLEKPTGGTRTPPTSGMTSDDVATLRKTNFKKYSEMLVKGQIKIES